MKELHIFLFPDYFLPYCIGRSSGRIRGPWSDRSGVLSLKAPRGAWPHILTRVCGGILCLVPTTASVRLLSPTPCSPFHNQTATMEPFEEDSPFESEPERHQSDSSSSRVDVSGVSSPDPAGQPGRLSSPPTSPSKRNIFPSLGSHRQPQAYKSDFCCGRDQWLHSGEDAEILVSLHLASGSLSLFPAEDSGDNHADFCIDNRRSQNIDQLLVPVYHIHNPSRGKQTLLVAESLEFKRFLRMQKRITDTPNSSRYATTSSSSTLLLLFLQYLPSRPSAITPSSRQRQRKTRQ